MNYCEATFAADPLAIFRHDPGIVKDGCFIKQHTSIMDRACERHFIWMEVVEA